MTTHFDRRRAVLAMALVLLAAGGGLAAITAISSGSQAEKAAKPLKLDVSTLIVEFNDTDNDIGLQPFADGEPWTRMAIFAPDGRRILDVDAEGKLNKFGLAELFAETNEPEFSEFPLRKFKKRFPAGKYKFKGKTIEGRKLVGKARLSHDIPNGPDITAPTRGQTVAEDDAVARWNPGAQPNGVRITDYQVIVETNAEDPRVFEADLPASVTSLTIPAEFLEAGGYDIEVLAIEKSGNQSITERKFRVG